MGSSMVSIILGGLIMSFFDWRSEGGVGKDSRRRDQIRRMFNKADKNKDGKLTPEEWKQVLNSSGVPTTMQEVDEFFQRMDRDYDGRLSFEEFMGEDRNTADKMLYGKLNQLCHCGTMLYARYNAYYTLH